MDVFEPGDQPNVGDVMRPGAAGRPTRAMAWYVVLEVRPVDSRLWHDRWSVLCRRVAPGTRPEDPGRVRWWQGYARGEGPEDVARELATGERVFLEGEE